MPEAFLEELKQRIASDDYAIDSGQVAGTILADMALIRRVRRLMSEDEETPERTAKPRRGRRHGRAPKTQPRKSRREQLS
jgi:hypothetical protein